MITIELKKILKEGLIILLILAALFVAILKTDKDSYIAPAIELFLLLFASFSGWAVFNREREEGAVEYMLSLPVSRPKLLFLKFLPRLLMIGGVIILYGFLNRSFELPSFFQYRDFIVFYFTFFLISSSFSISLRSFIGTFFLTAILSGGITFYNIIFDRGSISSDTILLSNLTLLALPLLFFICFFRFDLKPLFRFNLRFIGFSSLIILAIIGYRFLQVEKSFCKHLLTSEGNVYRMSPRGVEYLKTSGVDYLTNEIAFKHNKCLWPLIEKDNLLYVQNHRAKGSGKRDIYTFDKKNHSLKVYSSPEKGWATVFSRAMNTVQAVGDSMYLLQKNGQKNKYRIISLSGKNPKKYPLNINPAVTGKIYLFHVSSEPLKFFMRSGKKGVLIGSADGSVEGPFEADAISVWKNKLLLFRGGRITLYSAGDELKVESVREGEYRKIKRRSGSRMSDIERSENVVIRDRKNFYVFNFIDESFKKKDIERGLFFYFKKRGNFYLLHQRADGIAIKIYRDNVLVSEKKWETMIEGYKRTWVFGSGIIISNGRQYEKFLFKNIE
ncbi:MAG: ABC transporter permease subunit [Acidobacteriota bacterium]